MDKIRELRKAQGMTLADLAQKLGISIVYLSDIENGNRHGSKRVRQKIADELGVKVSELEG